MSGQKVLYFECFSGISGDMALAAMIDLGVPVDHLETELLKLGVKGWELRSSRASKAGIHGIRVDVDLLPAQVSSRPGPLVMKRANHDHRTFRDIRRLIDRSGLSDPVKARAVAIFLKLAEAEAKVHGTSVDEVHFHEVGAVDSIVDIVGAAIALEYLSPDRILCSRIELGGGFVKCQHGIIPVPAPAVMELLAGAPVSSGAVPFETTTPTGAAILAAVVDDYDEAPRFTIRKTAYGIGHRDTDIPNVLRLTLAECELPAVRAATKGAPVGSATVGSKDGVVLECNIDDMSPELHGHLFELFLRAGADDVWITPIVMKKNRPAVTLSVLSSPANEGKLAEIMIRETTTFGYRRREVGKVALERGSAPFESSYGPIGMKVACLGGDPLKTKPEYEDLKRASERSGIPLIELRERVLAEYRMAHKERQ